MRSAYYIAGRDAIACMHPHVLYQPSINTTMHEASNDEHDLLDLKLIEYRP